MTPRGLLGRRKCPLQRQTAEMTGDANRMHQAARAALAGGDGLHPTIIM
jgi:hypothetical protein